MMYNERWPFILTAFKESLDEDGKPITDENGDPTMVQMSFDRVIMDARGNPTFGVDGKPLTEEVTSMPWGYRTSTGGIKDSGEVFKADYKISCPMFITPLPEGTVLTLTDYDTTFDAVVKKKTTYNWGTNIWLDKPGNYVRLSDGE